MIKVLVNYNDHPHCHYPWLPVLVPLIGLLLLGCIIVLVNVQCLRMCRRFEYIVLECELLLSSFDVETYIGIVSVDDGFGCAQEGTPQDDGCLLISTYLYHHEVYRDIRVANLDADVFNDAFGIA